MYKNFRETGETLSLSYTTLKNSVVKEKTGTLTKKCGWFLSDIFRRMCLCILSLLLYVMLCLFVRFCSYYTKDTTCHFISMSSAISQQKKLVEQLRVECFIQRIPVSESIKDLLSYTEQNKEQDPLIVGIDKKQNPFMEKNSCAIL